jgi:hypothetical protein
MLDFIDDDTVDNGVGGEEDDLLTHIENLWQNHGGSAANHIVLGHQLNIGAPTNRGYQISVLGSGGGVLSAGGVGQDTSSGGSLPPHPLSVSAVHPLLVHHTDNSNLNTNASSTTNLTATNNNAYQITGLGINTSAGGLGSAISPILRTMRHHFQVQQQQQQQQVQQQQQQNQARPLRMSRFIFPGLQVQLNASASAAAALPPPTTASSASINATNQGVSAGNVQQAHATLTALPTIRNAPLPYNTLNEILQGFETPAAALQPSATPSVITAPTATSFIDLLTGAAVATAGGGHHHGNAHISHHHHGGTGAALGTSNSNNALASLNNQEFLVNLNSYNNDGFGENIGNGTTNLYIIRTPLARWNEECTVLDSHSMHHAILLNKPKIMDALEKYRNEELNEKREKKLKEEKEKLKRNAAAAEKSAQSAASAAAAAAATSSVNTSTGTSASTIPTEQTQLSEQEPIALITDVPITSATQQQEQSSSTEMMVIFNTNMDEQSSEPQPITDAISAVSSVTEPPQPPTSSSAGQQPASSHQSSDATNNVPSSNEMLISADNEILPPASEPTATISITTETLTDPAPTTAAAASNSPFATVAEREAATNFLINFVGASCSVFTIATADESRIAIEALRMADHHRGSLELQAATANEQTTYPQNYVFLDGHVAEIPSGIDPSFLSALPDLLRREVIMEQLRIQGIDIRNRPLPPTTAAAAAASTAPNAQQPSGTTNAVLSETASSVAPGTSSTVEINPEFLAALPPQIQEELLTQQRIEQQARAASANAAATGAGTSGAGNASALAVANADDDNTAFMRALPSSLRQAILFDMDHSQISALPEDLGIFFSI